MRNNLGMRNSWSSIVKKINEPICDTNILKLLNKYESSIDKNNYNFFYRGEKQIYETCLTPSVFRNANEKEAYFDALTYFPNEFVGLSALSQLAKMQHYTYPTRLLDLTTNPLVALWFASADYSTKTKSYQHYENDGQFFVIATRKKNILSFESDRALLLSCLAKLDDEEKNMLAKFLEHQLANNNQKLDNDCIKQLKTNNVNVFQKYISEVSRERTAFLNYRTNPKDIFSTFIVRPLINNDRLQKQNGLFAIFGLNSELYNNNDEYKIYSFVIPKQCKQKIVDELDKLGINQATLFGDIESRAKYNDLKKNANKVF